MTAVIMKIFTHQQTPGVNFPNLASARMASSFLVGITLGTVKEIYPDTLDFVASLISKAAECNKLHLFAGTAFRHFISDGVARFDQTILPLLRTRTFCHIILNVGCQLFLLRDTSMGRRHPHLICHRCSRPCSQKY